ncbi:DUF6531 domain-containing protein [Streptacidiphilus sp. N1-12]|uniref:DUF6531 domain-containing protein n=2 Tax=Streptacidiphilus alkalitolerans TaxID=3342712 RepID=A0ABV6V944_9ACTN
MTNRIVQALEDGARKLGTTLGEDAGKAVKDLYHSTGSNLEQVAKNTAEADAKHAGELKQLLRDGRNDTPREPGGLPGSGRGPGGEGGEPSVAGRGGPGQPSEGNGSCRTGGDPVDVVSGQMITSATDLRLPGLLPLLLRRAYASGYAGGRCFGPGWSSTLDQRVELGTTGIHYAGADAEVLSYPRPSADQPVVLPEHGARLPLTWDADSDTIRILDPGTGWTRHFGPVEQPASTPASRTRPITALTDRNGHRISFTQGPDGLPAQLVHSGGYRVAVDTSPTAAGPRVTALRLLDGSDGGLGSTVLEYGYDDAGRLTELVDSTGIPFAFDYDERDRITSWTDRNGHWYTYVYGPDGRVARGHGSDGVLAADFGYDPARRTTTVTDSLGHTTTYHYDEHGHVSAATDPLGHTVRTEQDRYGRLLSHQDALGQVTRFTLDQEGNPVRVVRPDGRTWTARYNAWSLPVEVRSPDGAVWRHSYDERGNRTETSGPAGGSTRYAYDEGGRPTAVTDALGRTTRIRCNQAGLTLETENPLGARTRYRRDAFGRPVAVTDALDGTTRFSWTPEGLLSARTAADGSVQSWTYDAEGNPTGQADQIGAATHREYGPFNRLTALVDADGTRHSFVYDTELRLASVTNPDGLTWRYDRDPIGRVLIEHDFNGRSVSYARDAVGRLLSRTNGAGQVVAYRYDDAGNLLTKTADGATTSYEHDAADRLVRLSSPSAEVTRVYDGSGRLIRETVNGRTVSHAYNALGQRTARTTPSGHSSAWTYDEAGRPLSLAAAGHTVGFDRDLMGRETARHLPGELALYSDWDERHRLTGQSLFHTNPDTDVSAVVGPGRGAAAVHGRTYTYRPDGQLLQVADLHDGTRRFNLDPLGRVTAVHTEDPSQTERYAYDGAGNLLDAGWPGAGGQDAQGARSYSGTLVRSAGRLRFEHDAQGRVTARRRTTLSGRTDVWTFGWDAEDRLTDVTTPAGDHWRYLYDPFGRRIAKQRLVADGDSWTVTEWTDFTWDATTLAEQTSYGPRLPGPYTLSWDHQGLQPIAQTESLAPAAAPASASAPASGEGAAQAAVDRRFFAVVTDLVGAPIRLLNPDGSAAWQSRATLWGVGSGAGTGDTSTPLRFPGQYYDPETRLHYNVHRYYDPATAGYLSPDPLGLLPSPNPHAYVSNPLRGADPLGLAPADPPPLGEHSNPFPNRGDAERAAFHLAGVPYGSPHDLSWEIGDDVTRRGQDGYMYDTEPTHWGNMRQYETPQGSRVIVEHTGDPAGPHFHAGMPKGRGEDALRSGVNFGWGGLDPDKDGFERYQKIDKPGGDHHLFYEKGTSCEG